MTQTAVELWNDPLFIQKRIAEQKQYMLNFRIRRYDPNGDMKRYTEVLESAAAILERLKDRQNELL